MSPGKGQGKEMGAQLMRKIKKVMDLLQVNWRTAAIINKLLTIAVIIFPGTPGVSFQLLF